MTPRSARRTGRPYIPPHCVSRRTNSTCRLLYAPIIDVDLARLKLWTRQLPVDLADGDTGLMLANVAALERVWERTKHGVEPTAPVDAALELHKATDAENLTAINRAATSLSQAISALHTR